MVTFEPSIKIVHNGSDVGSIQNRGTGNWRWHVVFIPELNIKPFMCATLAEAKKAALEALL